MTYYILTQDFYLHKHKKIPKNMIVKEYKGHSFGISSHEDIPIQLFIKEVQNDLLFSDNFYVIHKNVLEPYLFVKKEKKEYKNKVYKKIYTFLNRLYK